MLMPGPKWVSLCLVGQACLFYLPRALWLSLEGGLMKHLAKDKTDKEAKTNIFKVRKSSFLH